MALELALNLPITAKADVYYRVVILEMAKGIRLSSWALENTEDQESELTIQFVRVAKHKFNAGKIGGSTI